MIKQTGLYAMYDETLDDIGPIYQADTDEIAARMYAGSVSQSDIQQDMSLKRIGFLMREYDDNTKQLCAVRIEDCFGDVDKHVVAYQMERLASARIVRDKNLREQERAVSRGIEAAREQLKDLQEQIIQARKELESMEVK